MKKLAILFLAIILISCSTGNEPVTGTLVLDNQSGKTIQAVYMHKANFNDTGSGDVKYDEDWGIKVPTTTISPNSSESVKLSPGAWVIKIKNTDSGTYYVTTVRVTADGVTEVIHKD